MGDLTFDRDDAEQVRDLADRVRRAARTARRVAVMDRDAAGVLTRLAEKADEFIAAAEGAAEWAEERYA